MELILPQTPFQIRHRSLPDLHLSFGIQPVDLRDDLVDPAGIKGFFDADPQVHGHLAAASGDKPREAVTAFHDFHGVRQQQLPLRGQARLFLIITFEQPDTKLRFQLPDLTAQGRLGEEQMLRGPGEAAVLGCGNKCP